MPGTPLVSIFVDGLRADWVTRMPFLRSFGDPRRITTEFGYSIACHASMYTGASIEEHGYWFVWLRDDEASVFPKWLRRVPSALDHIPSRLAVRKALLSRMDGPDRPRGFFGVPRLVNVPLKQWPGLWVSEARFWDEDGYASKPTLFELVRRANISHHVVGLHRGDHLASVQRPLTSQNLESDWFYFFLGEVDHAAHRTAGVGPHFDHVLAEVDGAIRARCAEIEEARGGYDLLLWSDHGHAEVSQHVDLYERMPTKVTATTRHFVDTNFARFWTDSPEERSRLVDMLESTLPEGRVLREDEMRKWECWFPDGRYGDVIFYLDAPAAFSKTGWGFSRSQLSVHGYVPSNELMSATLVTTLDDSNVNRLRDVFGMHVDRLGLKSDGGR